MTKIVDEWKTALRKVARPEKEKIFLRFFQTGKGQYGEGDKFIGIAVPDNRKVAREFLEAPLNAVQEMLDDPIHEFRLSGFIALVLKFKKSKEENQRKQILDFYLANATKANNWDLVDLSAPYILGTWSLTHDTSPLLHHLGDSENLWEQRIAIVSTLMQIRHGQFDDTLTLAKHFLDHPHHLIHKAVGWMLREVGKKGGNKELLSFLDRNASKMPRIMLSYALERHPQEVKAHYRSLKQ